METREAAMSHVGTCFCGEVTVEVSGEELRWHFGPGLWSYRLALDEIERVSVVRNKWWNGFGIRMAGLPGRGPT